MKYNIPYQKGIFPIKTNTRKGFDGRMAISTCLSFELHTSFSCQPKARQGLRLCTSILR